MHARTITKVAVLFALTLSAVCQGAVLLNENFDSLTPATYNAVSAVGAFTVTSGSVDVVGPGFFGNLCVGTETNNCVDLNGNSAGTIASALFSLPVGIYTLSFDLNGSQRGVATSTTVSLGSVYSEVFNLGASDINSITRNINVTTGHYRSASVSKQHRRIYRCPAG
jgi:hypothetical protein